MILNPFGGKIYHFLEISSTMDAAKENLSVGNLFIAEYQTQGRGRVLQRQWQSEKGKNLLFTLVLSFSDLHEKPVTLLTSLALRRVLFSYGIHAEIKWPNDLLVQQAKIAGILAEIYQNYVLLGVGINLNQTDFPPIQKKITSVKLLLEKNADPHALLSLFLQELFNLIYHDPHWNKELNEYLWGKNQIVDYYTDIEHQKKITGEILCVQADGALQIKTKQGIKILYSAEN